MPDLDFAITLAMKLHGGKTDKGGAPYILHPLRVMASFMDPDDHDARIAAVLHDVVEDCEMTCEMLAFLGFAAAVVTAIDALSRRKGESYTSYIERASSNPLALRVKQADLQDNLNQARPGTALLSRSLKDRYRMAQEYLLAVRDDEAAMRSREIPESSNQTS